MQRKTVTLTPSDFFYEILQRFNQQCWNLYYVVHCFYLSFDIAVATACLDVELCFEISWKFRSSLLKSTVRGISSSKITLSLWGSFTSMFLSERRPEKVANFKIVGQNNIPSRAPQHPLFLSLHLHQHGSFSLLVRIRVKLNQAVPLDYNGTNKDEVCAV